MLQFVCNFEDLTWDIWPSAHDSGCIAPHLRHFPYSNQIEGGRSCACFILKNSSSRRKKWPGPWKADVCEGLVRLAKNALRRPMKRNFLYGKTFETIGTDAETTIKQWPITFAAKDSLQMDLLRVCANLLTNVEVDENGEGLWSLWHLSSREAFIKQ